MAIVKIIIQALIPYVIDFLKYIYREITLKRLREKRQAEAKKRADAYAGASTGQEIKDTFENLP